MPRLNISVAGEEADLSWPREKLIIEIDGGPFHQDKGEDARKEAAWLARDGESSASQATTSTTARSAPRALAPQRP